MDVEKLITEVFVRDPLWNQVHLDHHNRHILNSLWTEVANELECKRKYIHLYTTQLCMRYIHFVCMYVCITYYHKNYWTHVYQDLHAHY